MDNASTQQQEGGVVPPPASTPPVTDSGTGQATAGQTQVVPPAPSTQGTVVPSSGPSLAEHSLMAQELEQVRAQNRSLSQENAKRRIEMNKLTSELAVTVGLDTWDYDAYAKRITRMTAENTRLQQEHIVNEVASEKGLNSDLLLTLLKGESKLPTMFNEATKVELLNEVDSMMARYPGIKPSTPVGGMPRQQQTGGDLYTMEQLERLTSQEQRENRDKVTRSVAALGFS